MRIHNVLDKILNQEVKVRILRFFCLNELILSDEPISGRQLAKELKLNPATCHKALQELQREGVLNLRVAGRSYLYSLNSKNYVVKKILRPLYGKEAELYNDILSIVKRTLRKTKRPTESIALFGSIAKDEGDERSDLDILIVTSYKRDKVVIEKKFDSITSRIIGVYGIVVSPYILSLAELKEKYQQKLPIVKNILKTYKLIDGQPLEKLIA